MENISNLTSGLSGPMEDQWTSFHVHCILSLDSLHEHMWDTGRCSGVSMSVPLCHGHRIIVHRQDMGTLIILDNLWKYQLFFPDDRTLFPWCAMVPRGQEVSWTIPLNSHNVIFWGYIIYPLWSKEIHFFIDHHNNTVINPLESFCQFFNLDWRLPPLQFPEISPFHECEQ